MHCGRIHRCQKTSSITLWIGQTRSDHSMFTTAQVKDYNIDKEHHLQLAKCDEEEILVLLFISCGSHLLPLFI